MRRRYIFAGDFWEMRVDFIPRIDQGSALAVEVALRLLLSGLLRIGTFHLLRNGRGIGGNHLPLATGRTWTFHRRHGEEV